MAVVPVPWRTAPACCPGADPEVLAEEGGKYLPLPDDGGTEGPERGAGGAKC